MIAISHDLTVAKEEKSPAISGKSRLVKYYIHARYIHMVAPPPGTYLFQFYTLFTVFKASPVKGFEGTGIPYSL